MASKTKALGRKRKASECRKETAEEEEEEEMMETEVAASQTSSQDVVGGSSRARRAFMSLDQDTIDRKVGEIVRYLLCAEKRKIPVRKTELVDKVVGSQFSASFSCFMPLVKDKLSEVFGVHLVEESPIRVKSDGSQQPSSVRYYILTNQIAAHAREALLPCSDKERGENGLLFVILAVIMLKDGSLQEEHLWNMLRHLGIDSSRFHYQFGDVDNLIKKYFIEARYLERIKISAGDQYRFVYRWGSRATASVDKLQLLSLVAELHGDSKTRWEKQFSHMTSQN